MSGRGNPAKPRNGLNIQLLGPLRIERGGAPVTLPASRRVRGLLAYLAMAAQPVRRSALCDLFWEDGPADPRAELRWCLSRLRSALDEPGDARVVAEGETVALDLDGCVVDALDAEASMRAGQRAGLERIAGSYRGDFLEGLEIDGAPAFGSWLASQRRRLSGLHIAILERLAAAGPPDQALRWTEKWLELAPFDLDAHARVLAALAQAGRQREGESHLAAAIERFRAEGLDPEPLRRAWGASRAPSVQLETPPPPEQSAPRRASIAVMPLADQSAQPGGRGGIADALAYDITTRLAKLRSLFVIAQGSTFALRERRVGPEEAGRLLDVDYVLSGTLRRDGARVRITVELAETRSARVIWSEILKHTLDDAFRVLEEIGNRIVASIASEIETVERNRAILRPPSSLDAWEAHHRGLWHMYRFTRQDNAQARSFFEMAARLDPTFSRAWAGLSFTHWQDGFQGWAERSAAAQQAFAAAGQGLLVDDRDPAAHWAMGRALWMKGGDGEAVSELERAVELSPNFAQGHYALAFVQSQSGDPDAAIAMADSSRALSPFDPLLFAMLGARAMALARAGRYAEAAEWGARAAAKPNAHPHIHAIAAYCLSLAGATDAARAQAALIRAAVPDYDIGAFLHTFRFDAQGEALFRSGAARIGMG